VHDRHRAALAELGRPARAVLLAIGAQLLGLIARALRDVAGLAVRGQRAVALFAFALLQRVQPSRLSGAWNSTRPDITIARDGTQTAPCREPMQ
jgi:hypothetical protein